jgi:hypothetical protein
MMKASSSPLESQDAVNITLNRRAMKSENDVKNELKRKKHDLICPLNAFSIWFPRLSTRGCVKNFWDLDWNTKYESRRSEELAHRLHVERKKNGELTLEEFAPAARAMGIGAAFAGLGAAFAGLGMFLNALRRIRR